MKKIVLILLFIIVTTSVFAQWNGSGNSSGAGKNNVEYFGDNDVWELDEDGVEITSSVIDIYFNLDMERTNWVGFDPLAEGLLGVGLMLEFNRHNNTSKLMFAYNSEFDLSVANWVFIYNEAENAFLLGGQKTRGDTVHQDRIENDSYIVAIEIFMDENWTQWFANNPGGYYNLAIMEYNYGDNLIFRLPSSMFQRISSIYDEYM